jgi:Ulp1 family protease
VVNLRLTQFTQKRKDEVFKRFRKDQEEKLVSRRKEIEKGFANREGLLRLSRSEFTLRNEASSRTETFPITAEDMEKLRPEADLNDTIVGNYIKIFTFVFLPAPQEERSYFYSSFFIEKLIAEFTREDIVGERDATWLTAAVQDKVLQNYKNVKRWTRRIDIFEKEVLVFPINAFRHWFTVIVLRPRCLLADPAPLPTATTASYTATASYTSANSATGATSAAGNNRCELVYCDSMFEKREFVVAAVRKYLELELEEKRGEKRELHEGNLPCYQLLVPLS